MYNKLTKNDVIYELMTELGLGLNDEEYVISQKNNLPLMYNGKYIRFSYEEQFLIDGEKEIWFDPFNNLNLIKNLYNQYIVDLYYNEKIRINNTSEIREKESFKHKLHVSCTHEISGEKETLDTIFYNNIAVGYMQIILKNVFDISEFDN